MLNLNARSYHQLLNVQLSMNHNYLLIYHIRMFWHMKYPLHAQATDSSTPFKSRPVDSSAFLEHQFNMFKANMKFKVAGFFGKN